MKFHVLLLLAIVAFFSFPGFTVLDAKVYSGVIDVNADPDLTYFGYGYKKIPISELNFSNLPSINVYIRNPIITDCEKNWWIQLSDPRSLIYADGELYIAYRVAKGRPIFDGTYRVVLLEKVYNGFDRTFFRAGTPIAGETVAAFIVPSAITLKKVKIQVLTASTTGLTTIRLQKSTGNNAAFSDILLNGELSILPNSYQSETDQFFTTLDKWTENNVIRVVVGSVGAGASNLMITLVADYDN